MRQPLPPLSRPPPKEGRSSHPYTIGGGTARTLKGADEVIHRKLVRNRIPRRVLRYLLMFAREGTWFLDFCSGYQTNRKVVEDAGLEYIAVGIIEFFKLGSGPNPKTARAGVVADLTEVDPEELIRQIEEKYRFSPDDIAFTPPRAKRTRICRG